MAEAMATPSPVDNRATVPSLEWLALALTPGLGPTRARRLVERFGTVQAIFRATLTELEAAGIQAVSAQSLGTGRSLELAQDELGKAAAAGVHVVAQEDASSPAQLKQIYDPPIVLYVRGECGSDFAAGDCGCGHGASDAVRNRHGRAAGVRFVCARTGDF